MQQQQQQQELSQEKAPSEVIDAYTTKDGKRIIKTFLINSELNKLKFRIRPDYIPKHIQRFEGRPFILTEEHWHPRYEGIDYNRPTKQVILDLLESQQNQAIGVIRKIEPSNRIVNGGMFGPTEYNAYIELTDQKAIEAFDNGDIPKYVSPTVFKLHKDDPDDAITDFEPLHVACVDIPAWGFDVANIKGSCHGDLVTCYNQLKNNGISCIKAELQSFKNKYKFNSGHSSFSETFVYNGSLNNLEQVSEGNPNAGNSNSNSNSSSSNSNNSLLQQQQQKQQQQNQQENKGPLQQVQTPKPGSAAAAAAATIDELQQQLALEKVNKEQEDYKAKYFELEKKIQEFEEYKRNQEVAARRNIIESYITAEAIPEDQKRQEKIKFYLESAEPNDRLVEILKEVYLNRPLLTVHQAKQVKHGGILAQYADNSIGTLGSTNNGIKPELLLSFVVANNNNGENA